MSIRSMVVGLLRILAIFWGILAILGFFALLGLAQVIPVLNVLGGGLSAVMALILGLFLFATAYAGAEIIQSIAQLEKLMEIHNKAHEQE